MEITIILSSREFLSGWLPPDWLPDGCLPGGTCLQPFGCLTCLPLGSKFFWLSQIFSLNFGCATAVCLPGWLPSGASQPGLHWPASLWLVPFLWGSSSWLARIYLNVYAPIYRLRTGPAQSSSSSNPPLVQFQPDTPGPGPPESGQGSGR